jgi:hypothetical protein
VYFNERVNLTSKENPITVECTTFSGRTFSKDLKIERKSLSDVREPLRVGIKRFDKKWDLNFEESLESAMKNAKRFDAKILLDENEGEGKDFILNGRIGERAKSVELYIEMKDAETKKVLIEDKNTIDAYTELMNNNIAVDLANQINQKLTYELPIREGVVEKVIDDKQFIITIGKNAQIKEGMKITAYKIKPIFSDISHEILDIRFTTACQAEIAELLEKSSYASLQKNKLKENILQYPIITR